MRRLPASLPWCRSTRPKLWRHAPGFNKSDQNIDRLILSLFFTLFYIIVFTTIATLDFSRWFVCNRWDQSALLDGKVGTFFIIIIVIKVPSCIANLTSFKLTSMPPFPVPRLTAFPPGSETLRTLSRVVVECWHHSPPVRLTALRVKKTLARWDHDKNHNYKKNWCFFSAQI